MGGVAEKRLRTIVLDNQYCNLFTENVSDFLISKRF